MAIFSSSKLRSGFSRKLANLGWEFNYFPNWPIHSISRSKNSMKNVIFLHILSLCVCVCACGGGGSSGLRFRPLRIFQINTWNSDSLSENFRYCQSWFTVDCVNADLEFFQKKDELVDEKFTLISIARVAYLVAWNLLTSIPTNLAYDFYPAKYHWSIFSLCGQVAQLCKGSWCTHFVTLW